LQNVNELRDTTVRAAECVTNEILAVYGKNLNISLMYIVPIMVPTLRSAEQISNFMRSSVWRYIDFSNTFYIWRRI